jgi:hypothetical protein
MENSKSLYLRNHAHDKSLFLDIVELNRLVILKDLSCKVGEYVRHDYRHVARKQSTNQSK